MCFTFMEEILYGIQFWSCGIVLVEELSVVYPCGGSNLFAEFSSELVEFSSPGIVLAGEMSFTFMEEII